MSNPFCHIELATDDPTKAKEFYSKLFAWKFEDMKMPDGAYTMIKPGEGPGGGMMKKPHPEVPTAWLSYVLVESVADTVKKARSLGGKVLVDKTPSPDMGAFAVLADPTGGAIGVFESKK
jgi:predicted enzyme related to lactoylglutathione lyase